MIAITHDRYFLDNVAGWILELDSGPRLSIRRQLFELARAETGPAGARGKGILSAAEDAATRVGMGADVTAGSAGER